MLRIQGNHQVHVSQILLPEYIRDQNSTFHFACKRIMDVMISATALVLLSPIILVLALLVRLDSRGPSVFVQERVGARPRFENGQVRWEKCNFRFYKFRSMTHKSDDSIHRNHIKAFINGSLDKTAGDFKLNNDPRVTRIGKFLRKSSLDEIPQLWNVLKGDMSLVGPRPVPAYEVAGYQPQHFERLNAMPGITGLWQVEGRSRVSFEEMISMDIEYVRTRSFWMDCKLLFLTVPAAIFGRGAK
jgi:lipopolysaccharide/colanic/teichoic acid biosynthesis glycosyltransferase